MHDIQGCRFGKRAYQHYPWLSRRVFVRRRIETNRQQKNTCNKNSPLQELIRFAATQPEEPENKELN
jgi:hypothetical protein